MTIAEEKDKEKLKLVVGVSSGIYMAARTPELASIVRKLGFALTRGANAIELAGDVPHEIDFTQGKEIRYIAEKQDLTLLFHGSLTLDLAMPERGEWRDAEDHMRKSVRSAVMGGCKYVNFHACLNFWLELMTYAGRKLSLTFCDHEGKFISGILYDSEKLRKWFIAMKWDVYGGDVLNSDDRLKANFGAERQAETERDEAREKIRNLQEPELSKKIQEIDETYRMRRSELYEKYFKEAIEKKLKDNKKWDSEELRAAVGVIDGYHIMAHYLYYKKDPIWMTMEAMYKDVIDRYRTVEYAKEGGKKYSYSPGGASDVEVDYWLDAAWEKAESDNDRRFKEFYYAVCAAKYILGHVSETLKWMKDEGPDGLLGDIKAEVKDEEEFKKLKKNAEELKITLEIPDARSPEYAGLYPICRPKQIYAAVKTVREQLKTDKLFMLIDFEHIATQGFDPLNEISDFVKLAPDAGKFILSVHVTKPTPLHHHIQVEIGDIDVYRLIWALVSKAELGKHHTTYLIYERGGEQDPFKQSVTAIRLMVDQLQSMTAPEELVAKPEFFGVAGPALGSEERQRTVIQEHARDPIEGLLVVPEEKYTALGKAATEKAGAEKWKKEELA